jgi:hypothetical protein
MVFAKLDCKPRWRERLSELAIPALVVHGRRDPFFPVGNGEALAREIPGARLLVLERAATAIPDVAASEVAAADARALGTPGPGGYIKDTSPSISSSCAIESLRHGLLGVVAQAGFAYRAFLLCWPGSPYPIRLAWTAVPSGTMMLPIS